LLRFGIIVFEMNTKIYTNKSSYRKVEIIARNRCT